MRTVRVSVEFENSCRTLLPRGTRQRTSRSSSGRGRRRRGGATGGVRRGHALRRRRGRRWGGVAVLFLLRFPPAAQRAVEVNQRQRDIAARHRQVILLRRERCFEEED